MTTAPDRLLRRLEWQVVRRLDGRLQGAYRTPRRGTGIDFAGLRAVRRGRRRPAHRLERHRPARRAARARVHRGPRADRLAGPRPVGVHGGRRPGPRQARRAHRARPHPGPAARPRRQPGRRGAVRHRHGRASSRPAPAATTRCGSARDSSAPPTSRAAATTDLAAMLDAVASLARRCLVVVISDFIGTGEWERPLHPARAPARGRRAAGRRRRRRRAPRGRSDRGRGRRDRRAGARRLRRPAVPRPVPRRGRRAGGRTSGRHAPGRGAAAPRRHRQRPRRGAASRSSPTPSGGAR